MNNKTHKTYNMERTVIAELEKRHIKNVSNLINDLLKHYLQIKDENIDVLEAQIDDQLNKKRAELTKLENQKNEIVRKKESEMAEIQRKIEKGELIVIE